jgi:hypothetical protein
MANSAGMFWLPDFDPSAVFVVSAWPAGMTVNGLEPKRGQLFDKTSVPERVLHRMYMDRWLATVDNYEARPPEDKEEVPQVQYRQTSRKQSRASRL